MSPRNLLEDSTIVANEPAKKQVWKYGTRCQMSLAKNVFTLACIVVKTVILCAWSEDVIYLSCKERQKKERIDDDTTTNETPFSTLIWLKVPKRVKNGEDSDLVTQFH